jgi:hypothetical protein
LGGFAYIAQVIYDIEFMETIFRLNTTELSTDFVKSIKTIYKNQQVEIIVREIPSELADWQKAVSSNPVFDFLHDEAEGIYSVTDGKAFNHEE